MTWLLDTLGLSLGLPWERFYESEGIRCYMFRIDSDEVVDATMSWNMARFINHFCEVGVVNFGYHGYGVLFLSLPFFCSLPLPF